LSPVITTFSEAPSSAVQEQQQPQEGFGSADAQPSIA
jgi:hypothetical protein